MAISLAAVSAVLVVGLGALVAPLDPVGKDVILDERLVSALNGSDVQVAILEVERPSYASAHPWVAANAERFFEYPNLGMFAIPMTAEDLGWVAEIPGLRSVYANEKMHTMMDTAAPYVAANTVWKTYNVRGTGIGVLVVDTGVDGTHPDVEYGRNLKDNVMSLKSSAALLPGAPSLPAGAPPQSAAATDFDGHGTHVASIVGGLARGGVGGADSGKYYGIASGTSLIGFQAGVTDPSSDEFIFESTAVLDAFEYAITNQRTYNIRIVSNSWGTLADFDPNNPVNRASLRLYQEGFVVIFAAGNEGARGLGSLNPYSVAPWVLGVGAADYLNKLGSFSGLGTDPEVSGKPYDHPDVVAPGVGITAARAKTDLGCQSCPLDPAGPYVAKSGTSMATPIVSGIAALMLEENPALSPDDVYDILTATTTPIPQYEIWEAGVGYVHALNAFQLAKETPGNLTNFLKGNVKYAGADSGDPEFARDPVSVGYAAGKTQRLASGSQNLGQFAESLTTTANGWVFLVGTLVLVPLAFRFRGGA